MLDKKPQPDQPQAARAPYEPPKLKELGGIIEITQAIAGQQTDTGEFSPGSQL